MNINEAKQAAYSASNRAKGKCEELLKNPQHTKAEAIELLQMSSLLAQAATELVNLTAPCGVPIATETPRRQRKKV
jgi:hypothetical protein